MLIHGDCLDVLPTLPNASVDMVFADLPYRTTANAWDKVAFPVSLLWEQLLRLSNPRTTFVFTATNPFAATLITSQPKLFRYDIVWRKTTTSGFLNANCRPLPCHEMILVFSRATANPQSSMKMTYNPQRTQGKPYVSPERFAPTTNYNHSRGTWKNRVVNKGDRLPTSVLTLTIERGLHPTQKPVALLEWLIRTYTNEGDTVLDPTCGSGTTAIAALNTGRKWICIEKDVNYHAVAAKRIVEHQAGPAQGTLAL